MEPYDSNLTSADIARQYRIEVTGRLPGTLRGEIVRRFGHADFTTTERAAAIVTPPVDQASLRALLSLIWDIGIQVYSVRTVERPDGG